MNRDQLPVPRLQIEWTEQADDDGNNMLATYSLIYRHFLGNEVCVELGSTKARSSGYLISADNRELWKREDWEQVATSGGAFVHTPFRDGVHLRHDSAQLRLPAYAICGDVCEFIPPAFDKKETP